MSLGWDTIDMHYQAYDIIMVRVVLAPIGHHVISNQQADNAATTSY